MQTESVAAKTGDSVGGLLNATLGNFTELVIAIAALQAGQYTLVKASIAGAIVTNSLFMLGACFLLGGLRYHVQEFNRVAARFQAGLLFLATIALLIPSAVSEHETLGKSGLNQKLSLALSVLLLLAYGLGLWFSLNTHRELFASAAEEHEAAWPIGLALVTARGRHDFGSARERSVRRVRSIRCDGLRNESRIRWVHYCGLGRRSCRNDGSIFGGTKKSSGFERGHCAGQRCADRALRCSGSGVAQLFHWACTYGFEFVAGGSRNDSVRNAHRIPGDQRWALHLVRRRFSNYGLPDVCHGALPFATTEYLN